MVLQVSTLMWMRTMMNFQYKNGGTTSQAFKTLYAQGGFKRFYRGYFAALMQGPLSRFGDTAANTGILVLMNRLEATKDLDIGSKTAVASVSAGLFRVTLMPIDAVKTNMQVGGSLKPLLHKMKVSGPTVLWHGALGSAGATMIGHFPWFGTFNYLQTRVPMPEKEDPNFTIKKLGRNAAIGFCASVVSDCVSNSVRVIKTVRQTNEIKISYAQAVKEVVSKDGVLGLFGRGLKTRIITNGTQGLMFSVLWKLIDEQISGKQQ